MRLALALVCALGGAALASPESDRLFDEGQAAYKQGKYRDAIDKFEQAYKLERDAVYLFNIAQSYRKVLDCVAASEYYRRYLDESPKAENRAKVEQWISELQPCVDERKQAAEAARKLEEAERQRREAEQRRASEATQRPVQGAPYELEVDRGKPLRIAGIATGALGLAGLAVGIAYGVKGNNVKADIAELCSPPNTCQWDSEEIRALDAEGDRANTLAKVGYIGGGIATIVGVGLYMFGRSRVETVMVTPGADGTTVSARFAF